MSIANQRESSCGLAMYPPLVARTSYHCAFPIATCFHTMLLLLLFLLLLVAVAAAVVLFPSFPRLYVSPVRLDQLLQARLLVVVVVAGEFYGCVVREESV